MALDFPNTPTTGQVFGDWIYDGEKWRATQPQFVPEDFSIGAKTDQAVSTTVTSEGAQIVAVRGGRPCAISITGGEYQTADDSAFSVNASSWSSSAGTIAEDQYVRVRLTSSSSLSTLVSCTLTIGPEGNTESDTFNVTTRAAVDVFLTTTGPGTWPVPGVYNPANNYVEVLGGGAPGGTAPGSPLTQAASGGGGGGFARKNNVPLGSPTAPYQVGAASGETWFSGPTVVRATGGTAGTWAPGAPSSGGAGGTGTAGDTLRTGGAGGASAVSGPGNGTAGGGGGGAAGFGGNGGNGANGALGIGGGGGGGGGSGGAGSNGSGATGGAGGPGGGGNGGPGTQISVGNGTPGSDGTWMGGSPTKGSGGGGGGGWAAAPSGTQSGFNGGLYGGGGGGSSRGLGSIGGVGAQGIIHISF